MKDTCTDILEYKKYLGALRAVCRQVKSCLTPFLTLARDTLGEYCAFRAALHPYVSRKHNNASVHGKACIVYDKNAECVHSDVVGRFRGLNQTWCW
jgi:hypothetical protein